MQSSGSTITGEKESESRAAGDAFYSYHHYLMTNTVSASDNLGEGASIPLPCAFGLD